MLKLYRTIKFFFVYRKNLLANAQFLEEKYGFDINLYLEFYTTVLLGDAPVELRQKLGKALVESEMKKFIALVNADLPKLDLDELVGVYEIKRVDDYNWGVAFGYKLAEGTGVKFLNNRRIIWGMLGVSALLIFGLMALGIYIF